MARLPIANHAHADLAKPAQVGGIAKRLNAVWAIAVGAGEGGDFLYHPLGAKPSPEAGQCFAHDTSFTQLHRHHSKSGVV